MSNPTMLELAIKEWGHARDALSDMYAAVYLARSFDRAFVGAVRKSYDVDLDLPRPYNVHLIECVLRETKVFIFLKNHLEDPDDFIFGDTIPEDISDRGTLA